MNEPKTYTAKDIERYHSGDMTPAEMHLLEEASLDDPFLADALEGYQSTTTASADLAALQKRLQGRIEGKRHSNRVIFIYPWMKIAAVLVVLVGGGWLVFQTFSGRPRYMVETVARRDAGADKTSAAQSPDSGAQTSTFAMPLTDSNKQEKENTGIVSLDAESKAYHTRRKPVIKNAPAFPKKDALAEDKTAYTASANALSKMSPGAENKDADNSLRNEQSTAAASAPALDTVRHIDVAMKQVEDNLQEVVITKSKRRQLAGNNSGVKIDTLEPAQGWSSFGNYIAENLEVPNELKEKKPLNNEVELSFDVDAEGNPINIAVTKSLCDKCDQEAIRLLKEGPKWKGKKKSGKVKIAFPLFP